MRKTIEFWEVNVTFLVRKDNDQGLKKTDIFEQTKNGIGGNDMESLPAEEITVSVK